MFSNLSWQGDKQAFFALLDEYFESRPQHRPSTDAAAAHTSSSSSHGGAPPVSFGSKPPSAARSTPPASIRTQSHTSVSPPTTRPGSSTASSGTTTAGTPTTGARQLGQAKGAFNDSMAKVTSNSTVKSTLGKVGAGGLASKFSGGSTFKATGNVPGPGERHMPPPPPGRTGGTPGRFGAAGAGGAGGGYGASTGTGAGMAAGGGFNAYADEKPAPAYNGAGRAQANYDFDGGDVNDLPLQAGEVVTLIAKTSPDWWTCQNASGKQGLVPANYMTEL